MLYNIQTINLTFLFFSFFEREGKPSQRQNEYHKREKRALAEGRQDPSGTKTPSRKN